MKHYVLTEKDLRDLLERALSFEYLELAGVHKWQDFDYAFDRMRIDGFEDIKEATDSAILLYNEVEL